MKLRHDPALEANAKRLGHAEDWLAFLGAVAATAIRPRLATLFDSDDPRDHHHYADQLRRLEQRGLLKRERQADDIVYQLTTTGQTVALGGRDPVPRWDRPWDGQWRLLMFDLPVGRQTTRQRLLRWLREHGFGYLQHSVWVTPDPAPDAVEALKDFPDMESFAFLEARCVAGHTNADLVQGAWDFADINQRYTAYLDWLAAAPAFGKQRAGYGTVRDWLRLERARWLRAFTLDPLLPRALWPKGYRGEEAYRQRRVLLPAKFRAR